ncbi:MAG: Asp-tRNA(Asn)/Glu-tRNA(Gln) amidotransferase subunit GatB [Candidatus Nomurabacteria bacterium]|jgi:aspartyl-tRNA(Asn)/glutamyl-tRNA(Gln) amidotransferase subunit B|nr:Asp-tRNA(Asn)/Glu-tRNA(Gln) amidotransferase subunit GatB [Candidatus Nomurabacteria bacterium]
MSENMAKDMHKNMYADMYEMTVGIECHVQLATKTKLFSAVDNDARGKEPNACVSPVDYALPGMLPMLNSQAVVLAVRMGEALGAKINPRSHFDRKHYYYPDLPKGYQTTQFYAPIIGAGKVVLPNGHSVRVEHAHLEEDAGKLTHFGDYSLVDLNRAGTPLIEIVSQPDIHSAEDARLYAEELWRLATYAGVSFGDLYHGNMRFDVNISVAEKGAAKLGTRVEVKNLNSFRSVERAASFEFERQAGLLAAGRGAEIRQETRGWSDATGKTTTQRSKEEAQDYRYMPDPDVPPLNLSAEFIAGILAEMPKLPAAYRAAFAGAGIAAETVEIILGHQILAVRLLEVLELDAKLAVKVANLFTGTLLAEENAGLDLSVASGERLAELAQMNEGGELSSTATKQVLVELYDTKNSEKSAKILAKEMNLLQENDDEALEKIILGVLDDPAAASAVADVRAGEMKAVGFLIGLIMKNSGGKANPARARELLLKKLG